MDFFFYLVYSTRHLGPQTTASRALVLLDNRTRTRIAYGGTQVGGCQHVPSSHLPTAPLR